MHITDAPYTNVAPISDKCGDELDFAACGECAISNEYLPKLVIPKPDGKFGAYARALFNQLDELYVSMCELSDCEKTRRIGLTLGIEPLAFKFTNDTCIDIYDTITIENGCYAGVYKIACDLCDTVCERVELDVCGDEYQKIVEIAAKYYTAPRSRDSIEAYLSEWYGVEAHVVMSGKKLIYWTIGRELTADELAYLPIVYKSIPAYRNVKLINIWS